MCDTADYGGLHAGPVTVDLVLGTASDGLGGADKLLVHRERGLALRSTTRCTGT